eukprot:CAMPEP_0183444492 /NCGR_PEP_ID=MMETSP0370-20130417/95222_1 /TAXON_ID=268820 /ORGANISM="Peridinium aciculiferum, Strain PAER-2" /LENGTH=267 /DNA_ID=CAMNT_0025634855 /DNA_START=65 /DNA_END=865 /DNA_ORIENTATION=-
MEAELLPTLMQAVRSGNVNGINTSLKAGADLNGTDGDGQTPLMMACCCAQLEAVKALVEAGADLNAKNEEGRTALMNASVHCDVENVKALVEAGANVDAKTEHGITALMLASSIGSVECVTALVEAGAELNAKNYKGQTALWIAEDSQSGTNNPRTHQPIAEYLRSKGAIKWSAAAHWARRGQGGGNGGGPGEFVVPSSGAVDIHLPSTGMRLADTRVFAQLSTFYIALPFAMGCTGPFRAAYSAATQLQGRPLWCLTFRAAYSAAT